MDRIGGMFMQNPALAIKRDKVKGVGATTRGIAVLTMCYLGFVVAGAFLSWRHPEFFMPHTVLLAFATLGIGYAVCYMPDWTYLLGPVYAVVEGFLIGACSYGMEMMYEGIVLQAVSCTFGIALACGFVYSLGIFPVTERFRRIVSILCLGICFVYVIDLFGFFFLGTNIPLLHESSPKGILVSVVIIVVAVFRLYVDYDTVDKAVEAGVDVAYEPYYAFALTVTLLWLYLEILRLLGKSRSRK